MKIHIRQGWEKRISRPLQGLESNCMNVHAFNHSYSLEHDTTVTAVDLSPMHFELCPANDWDSIIKIWGNYFTSTGFFHPDEGTENRTRYGRLVYDMCNTYPNQRNLLSELRSDRLSSSPKDISQTLMIENVQATNITTNWSHQGTIYTVFHLQQNIRFRSGTFRLGHKYWRAHFSYNAIILHHTAVELSEAVDNY